MPENTGAILRTASEKKTEQELAKDLEQLINKWQKIKSKFEESTVDGPQLLYTSPSIIEKIILDMPENRIERMDTIEKPKETKKISLDFDVRGKAGNDIIKFKYQTKSQQTICLNEKQLIIFRRY